MGHDTDVCPSQGQQAQQDRLSPFQGLISSAPSDLTRTDRGLLKYPAGQDVILRIMLTSNKQLEDSTAPAFHVTSTLQGLHTAHWWGLQSGRQKVDVAQEAGTEDVAQQLRVCSALVKNTGLVPSTRVGAHTCL